MPYIKSSCAFTDCRSSCSDSLVANWLDFEEHVPSLPHHEHFSHYELAYGRFVGRWQSWDHSKAENDLTVYVGEQITINSIVVEY